MLELSGVSKATEAQNRGEVPLYNHVILGLGQNMSRDVLYDRINRRVDLMMENGLLQEVKGLWRRNIRGVQSIQAIGYKELYDYLDGKCTLEEALDSLKQNSRRYAKDSLLISVIKWMSILLRLMIDYKNKEKFLKITN